MSLTLVWMDKVREQMGKHKIHPNPAIETFIRPIIKYGESEERRIAKEFRRKK